MTTISLAGRLSDSLVRVGPFSLGLDGVLSWVPGLGDLYSTAAGAFIVVQGARARRGVEAGRPVRIVHERSGVAETHVETDLGHVGFDARAREGRLAFGRRIVIADHR